MKNDLKPSILLLLCLIGFPQISETIYSPSLPAIALALHTSQAWVQWTLSVYFIGFALGVLCWGYVSDYIGRRPSMLLGIVTYTLGSLGCLLAHHIGALMIMRCVQAFGASVGSIITMTIIRECYEGDERNHLFAIIGMALSSTSALGPVIGGYLSHYLGWESNFVTLFLMGIVLVWYAFCRLPETYAASNKTTISLLHIIGRMLRSRHVLACTWVIAAINGVIFSFWQEAPFVFTHNIGLTSSEYGYMGIAIGLASYVGSWGYKRLLGVYSSRDLYRLGLMMAMGMSFVMYLMTILGVNHVSSHLLAASVIMVPMMGLVFALVGFVLPHVLSHAMDAFSDYLGRASALFGFSYYLGVSLLTWGMGYLHNDTCWMMPLYLCAITLSVCVVSRWVQFDAGQSSSSINDSQQAQSEG